ncbi:MAG TPA: hypothetical protein VFE51_29600 [Verrucomicrobiae bacterium]|nr:hypothetical protein [Verrucomicrobiae bacterium]
MKTTTWIALLTFLLISGVGALAADKTVQAAPKPTAKAHVKRSKTHSSQRIALTGSYIKQDIHRNGVVTDGPNAVVVLDNEAIRNSGAADLRQLLVLRGVHH